MLELFDAKVEVVILTDQHVVSLYSLKVTSISILTPTHAQSVPTEFKTGTM